MPSDSPKPKGTVEDIIATHTPQVRGIVGRLRQIILEAIPEGVEVAYPGWHGIGYSHPQVGYFCAIFPHKNVVRLGFEFGVLLPDSDHLLQGQGRQVRYIYIQDESSIPVEGIRRLLRLAIRLPAERSVRLAMVNSGALLLDE